MAHGWGLQSASDDLGEVFGGLRALDQGHRFRDLQQFLLLTEFRLYALRNPHAREQLAELERELIAWYAAAIDDTARRLDAELPIAADRLALMLLGMENGIAMLAHLDPDGVPATAVWPATDPLTEHVLVFHTRCQIQSCI